MHGRYQQLEFRWRFSTVVISDRVQPSVLHEYVALLRTNTPERK